MGRPGPLPGRRSAVPMSVCLLVATSRRGRRLASLGSQRLHAESAIHGDSRRGHEIRGSMGDQMGCGDSAACRQQRRRRMLEATARRGVKGRSQPRPISTEGSPQGLVEGPGVAWPSHPWPDERVWSFQKGKEHMPSSTGSELSPMLQARVDRLWVTCVNCSLTDRQATWDKGVLAIATLPGASTDAMADAVQDAGFRLGTLATDARTARSYGWLMG